MKLYFLLLGTTASLFPLNVKAQCVATQDCAALGYTETSCNGSQGIKCPFGNKWACLTSEEDVCNKNGFTEECKGIGQIGGSDSCGGLYKKCSCDSTYQYTCTGTGYAGGLGTICGGMYTQCNCSSGYEWKNGSCQKKEVINGADGDVYKCNGKVVGIRNTGMDFYVAMRDLGSMYWDDGNNACRNYSFCGNIRGILPSKDQLLTIYKNKSQVNSLLSTNGGTKLAEKQYWSSTPGSTNDIHNIVHMSNGSSIAGDNDTSHGYVRPVLTSY